MGQTRVGRRASGTAGHSMPPFPVKGASRETASKSARASGPCSAVKEKLSAHLAQTEGRARLPRGSARCGHSTDREGMVSLREVPLSFGDPGKVQPPPTPRPRSR